MTDSEEPKRHHSPGPSGAERRSGRALLLACLATAALTGLDLASKDWMMERLSRPAAVERPVCRANTAGPTPIPRVSPSVT